MAGTVEGQRFPKAVRLRRRAEFLRVQNGGAKASSEHLLALALKGEGPDTRVGLTVSSKVGNAVIRARVRRHLREVFRKKRGQLPSGLDLVLIAKVSAKDADARALERSFDALSQKLRRLFA